MRGNGEGILVRPSSAAVVTVEQVRLEGNGSRGLLVEAGAKVTVRNSIASGGQDGLAAESSSAAATELDVENCVASNNVNVGIRLDRLSTGAVTVRVSNSTVTDNNTGLTTFGTASLLSRGNNTVEGNVTDGSFTGAYSAK